MDEEELTIPFGGFIQNLGQLSDDSIDFYLMADGTSIAFGESRVDLGCIDSNISSPQISPACTA